MLISEIKPGVYETTKDVKNPEGDRRVKDNWTKMTKWPKGSRFIIRKNHHDKPEEAFFEVVAEGAKYSHHRVSEFMPAFLPLVEAFEPTEENIHTVLTGQHHMAYEILESLVEQGTISLANIKETLDKIG